MTTGHLPCCWHNEYYTVRRYGPNGRTLWTRDYFRNAVGSSEFAGGLHVAVLDDRVYVAGPIVWSKESNPESYWSVVCYAVNGDRLWRRDLGDVADVASNGSQIYLLLNNLAPTNEEGTTLRKIDDEGNVTSEWHVPFMQLGNCLAVDPDETVHIAGGRGSASVGQSYWFGEWQGGVAGDAGLHTWTCLTRDGRGRTIIGGVNFGIVEGWPANQDAMKSRDTPGAAVHWSQNLDGNPSTASSVDALAATDDFGLVTASGSFTRSSMTGTLGRWDADGNLLWARGTGRRTNVEVEVTSQSIYSSVAAAVFGEGTVEKRLADGTKEWAHDHMQVSDIAPLSLDGGAIYVGGRKRRGINETDYV